MKEEHDIVYFDGSEPEISRVMGDTGDCAVYLDEDGAIAEALLRWDGDAIIWHPIEIIRNMDIYLVQVYHQRDDWASDQHRVMSFHAPRFDDLHAAHAMLNHGYGTPAAWRVLLDWAAACLP